MPNRVYPDINSSIYTETNPEDIISARMGALFFRKDKSFYVNYSGNMSSDWILLPYSTVILPRPSPNKLIQYKTPTEIWRKTTDGYYDEFKELLPKKGWKFYSYDDAFASAFSRSFNWFFPVPVSSSDSVGVNGSKSYDENFYYLKSGSLWYRTPITLFYSNGVDDGEQPNLYNNPPYVVSPRYLPVPSSSLSTDSAKYGDQTYDRDYFYIKPLNWKRSILDVYETSKMTRF